MKLPKSRDALLFKCPTCGSRSMKVCYSQQRRPMRRFHKARQHASRWTWGQVMQVVRETHP